ncbi:MAG TPA: GatB/YqeY domain-containing protein [Mollicutes bacterium]|jgi:uncharacterized protein YqeY|nr:GatB/YqeY domain-containing protein [Mollicutes bacterium]
MLDKINKDMIDAMKNHEKNKVDVIRMIKGSIQLEEISKKRELTDEDILDIIAKQVKMRKESIEEFKKVGRTDLIAQNESELEILFEYLPAQLSEEELSKIIDDVITKVDAKNIADMGKIMKELIPSIKGKADMNKVNVMIKEKLSAN